MKKRSELELLKDFIVFIKRDNIHICIDDVTEFLKIDNSFCLHHEDPHNQCSYLSWFKNCGKCEFKKTQ